MAKDNKEIAKRDSFGLDIDMSDFMMIIMMVVMASIVSTLSTTSVAGSGISGFAITEGYPPDVGPRALEEGDVRPTVLRARHVLQYLDLIHTYPFTPWNSAYFINDGPYPVEIGINHPQERFIMNPGETITVDSALARYKIAIIFYICQPSQTATVRVAGGY